MPQAIASDFTKSVVKAASPYAGQIAKNNAVGPKPLPPAPPVIPPWGSGANAAQVSKNTTGLPTSVPGSGPTYDPYAPPAAGSSPGVNPDGSIQVGSNFTPDYAALLAGDPSWMAYQNNEQGTLANAATSRAAAIKAAMIQYGGGLPSGVTDTYGDITPDITDLASQNQYSDLADINRSYTQGLETFKRGLAARGVLQSGDLGYGLDQAATNLGQQQYDAGNNFANSFNSAINSYLGTVNSQKQGEAGALSSAESDVYNNPANRPTTSSSANLVPNWQALYGSPVYSGPDGTLYNADGSTH